MILPTISSATTDQGSCLRNTNSSNDSRMTMSSYRCNKNLGLINLGNTCYLNAAIQMICCRPEFLRDLKIYDDQQKTTSKLRKALLQLASDMCCFDPDDDICCSMKEDEEEKKEDAAMVLAAANPSALKASMDQVCCLFEGYQQQDSHEFLSTLLDILHDEIMDELAEQQQQVQPQQLPPPRTMDRLEELSEDVTNAAKRSRCHLDKSSSYSSLDQDAIFSLLHEEIPLSSCSTSYMDSNNDISTFTTATSLTSSPPLLLLGGRIAPSSLTDASSDITASLKMFSTHNSLKTTQPLQCQSLTSRSLEINNTTTASINSATIAEEATSSTILPSSLPTTPNITSPVETHFCSFVDVRLTCDSCSYTRTKTEMYRYLSIDLVLPQPNVEDGLKRFFQPEKIDLKCEKCFFERATQTKQIVKLPKSLLIHFKRFLVTTTSESDGIPTISFTKNQSPVDFNLTLDFKDFHRGNNNDDDGDAMDDDDETATMQNSNFHNNNRFQLVSVVHHIGRTASCGHYTADGLRTVEHDSSCSERRRWMNFNDDYVTDKEENDIVSNTNQASSAYMVLYESITC